MTESTTPNQFTNWKRPLVGGLLSAMVAGISLFLDMKGFEPFGINSLGWIFTIPIDFSGSSYSDAVRLTSTILLWLFYGFGLTYFIKDNGKAIGCWFVPVILLVIFAFILMGMG